MHNANTNYQAYNIVDKVLTETRYDAAGNQKAKTEYEYDSTSLTLETGAPQHDDTNYHDTFLYRGNPTKVKRWRDTDGVWLTATYGYDTLGNIRAITNPRNFSTTYTYADQWANMSCAPPSNSRAYVTEATNPAGHRVRRTYYPCTGTVQARQDENDILNSRVGTTYVYDLLGRPTATNYPDGGQITVSYVDTVPFRATTTNKINATLN